VGATAEQLTELARIARVDTLKELHIAQSGHPGSSLSAMDAMVALYFGGFLRHRVDDPEWEERDVFVLSPGHAAPGYYAVLVGDGVHAPTSTHGAITLGTDQQQNVYTQISDRRLKRDLVPVDWSR